MFGLTPYTHRGSVSTWNPFAELDALEKAFFGSRTPAEFKTDIRDLGDKYLLEADLPGFRKEDIKVDAENGYLTISAERSEHTEDKNENGDYLRRERSYGSFSRMFDISEIDETAITAKFENGVLALTLPKREVKPATSHSIAID